VKQVLGTVKYRFLGALTCDPMCISELKKERENLITSQWCKQSISTLSDESLFFEIKSYSRIGINYLVYIIIFMFHNNIQKKKKRIITFEGSGQLFTDRMQ